MQWGWAFAYLALVALAARIAWSTPERLVGVALVVNVVSYNALCALMPPSDGPGVAMLTELLSFEAAVVCLVLTNRPASLALALLSVISISISGAKALEILPFFGYEEAINAILVAQCVILSWRGLMNVVLCVGSGRRNFRNRRNADRLPSNGVAAVSRRAPATRNAD